jgi:hypothetical protein
VLLAVLLGADLDDAVVLPGGLDRRAALADRRAQGFFHVHVLAGLAGVDRGKHVPVADRADDHRVNVLVVQ